MAIGAAAGCLLVATGFVVVRAPVGLYNPLSGLHNVPVLATTPKTPSGTTSRPSDSSAAGVLVPHVYNLSAAAGDEQLRAAGFRARNIPVCSDSVQAGNVRQVLTDVGDAEGIIVDDAGGVTQQGRALASGTALVVKVATGASCHAPATSAASTPTPTPRPVPSLTPVLLPTPSPS